MITIRIIFEMFPILLGLIAITTCGYKILVLRRNHDRSIYILMVVSSILLIISQTNWTFTIFRGEMCGDDIANIIGTLFNILVAITFIFSAKRVK